MFLHSTLKGLALGLGLLILLPQVTHADDEKFSIQSFNHPDRYIRHRNSLAYLEKIDSELAAADATFLFTRALASKPSDNCYSLEASNRTLKGWYLRHQSFRLKLSKAENTDLFRNDATFCLRKGIARPTEKELYSFESLNFPGYFIRHTDFELRILQDDGGNLFKPDATFKLVRPVSWSAPKSY